MTVKREDDPILASAGLTREQVESAKAATGHGHHDGWVLTWDRHHDRVVLRCGCGRAIDVPEPVEQGWVEVVDDGGDNL